MFSFATIQTEVPNVAKVMAGVRQANTVFFLGDSTSFFIWPSDTDRRTIPEMLAAIRPDLRICAATGGRYHLQLYEEFCRYISRHAQRSDVTVVFPVNLRSFGAGWDKDPMNVFQKEIMFLRYDTPLFRAFFRPLAVFKAFDLEISSRQKYWDAPIYDGEQRVGSVQDYYFAEHEQTDSRDKARRRTVAFYMAEIPPDHPKLNALRNAVRALKEKGLQAVVYILPVNHTLCRELVGERFDPQLVENVALLRGVAEAEGAMVLDLSYALPRESFYEKEYPDDHLKQTGRLAVAEQIAAAIR